MIGTFIRSTHHLEKSGGYLQPRKIITIRNNNVIFGELIIGKNRAGNKRYYYFQNVNNNIDRYSLNEICDAETEKVVSSMLSAYPRCTVFTNLNEIRSFGTQFLMLPTDFEEQYQSFLKQNKKVVTPVLNKYCDASNPISKVLFCICESGNYFAWAMKNFFSSRISIMSIYRIMLWQAKYSQLVSKLSNKTITAYNNTGSVLNLMKECSNLRKVKRANDIVNMFNTEQKKLLKANFSKLPIEVLNKFSILSKTKQQNFIRKVSTITDLDEIIRLMAFTTSQHFKWSKESLLEYIHNVEGLDCKIVLENETSVLVEVHDYETIKKLAKTTNWCISKNKSYWNNYAGHNKDATQYVLFDFSKKEDDELSIVGFTTVNNKGITHAHSFTNVDLMGHSHYDDNDEPYEGLLKENNVRSGIYAVISNNNIPLSLVTKFSSQFPIWTKEAFIDRFFKVIGEDKCTIYYEEDDKIVISTRDINGVINLLGKTYANKFCDSYRDCEHIFFADFSKDASDNDKLKFAIVSTSSYNNSYSSANTIYNEYGIKNKVSFNNLLEEYHLPYDIICRPNTIKHRFIESVVNHNTDGMEKLIGNNEIKNLLSSRVNNEIKNYFKRELLTSIQTYNSVVLINMIEKCGLSLSNFLSLQDVKSLILYMYVDCCGCGGNRNFKSFNKTEMFDKLLNGNIDDWNHYQRVYVAKYYMIDRILKPYRNNFKAMNVILDNVASSLNACSYGGFITEEFINMMLESPKVYKHEFNNIISCIFSNNMNNCIEKLLTMDINDERMRTLILNYATSRYSKMFKEKWGIKVEEFKVKPEELKVTLSSAFLDMVNNSGYTVQYTNTPDTYAINW